MGEQVSLPVVERLMKLGVCGLDHHVLHAAQSPCEIGSEEHFCLCDGRSCVRSEQRWVSDGFLLLSVLYLIMDLLWMILPVFLVCAEAENPTEVKVELGQNVILNCSVDKPNIYWYMELHSQLPGFIVRTFSMDPNDNYYCDSTFSNKFIAVGKRLEITNITAEDCRLYFCAKKQNDIIIFEDAFRLVSDVPFTPSTSDSEANHQRQHIRSIWQNEVFIYSSFTLNALLLLVIIGLVFTSLCLKKKNCSDQVNDPSPLTCENPETLETRQYEEIQLPPYRAPPPAAPPPECIYHKAQLPRSTLPRH